MSHNDLIHKITYGFTSKDQNYKLTKFPILNSVIGNIVKSKYVVVAGLPGVGISSFINQNYVLGPLLQYVNDIEGNLKPLRILYFSTAVNAEKKYYQLLCHYLMLVNQLHVDVPTLFSSPGRIFDINTKPEVIAAIDDSESFFTQVLDNYLHIIDNMKTPSNISAYVNDYIEAYNKEHEDDCTFIVVVDSTNYLEEDKGSFVSYGDKEIEKEMNKVALSLVNNCNVHCVLSVPAKPGFIRSPKDSEPSYSHLGSFGGKCDVGIVLYDSLEARHPMTEPYRDVYINTKGRNTLRHCYVVRNSEGNNLFKVPYLFLGGSGYCKEISTLNDFDSYNAVVHELLDSK